MMAAVGPARETSSSPFPPLEEWKNAVTQGGGARLEALYSTNPKARVETPAGETDAAADVRFWSGLKARRLQARVVESASPQPGLRQFVLATEIHPAGAGAQTLYVNVAQIWQQQGNLWRLVALQRTDASRLEQPVSTSRQIYPAGVDAQQEIAQALRETAVDGKHVLLVFGANWCYDCHVLELAFERSDLAPVLRRDYLVVHIDVGKYDKNQDVANRYQVPLNRGVPAVVVLDSKGQVLFAQQHDEFGRARSLTPEFLLHFLNQWKPQTR
jgi:thiol-disulfide isomerase/thioredoxin